MIKIMYADQKSLNKLNYLITRVDYYLSNNINSSPSKIDELINSIDELIRPYIMDENLNIISDELTKLLSIAKKYNLTFQTIHYSLLKDEAKDE